MDARFAGRDVFLNPGEWFAGDAPCRVRTILGSCVSITLWHRERRIGAMSHFVLGARTRPAGAPFDGRYGEEAMELMCRRLRVMGVEPGRCEAKLFGGGDMSQLTLRSEGALDVGQANGSLARWIVAAHGIQIHAESLFGAGHREISFDVSTGDVWARQVPLGSSVVARGG